MGQHSKCLQQSIATMANQLTVYFSNGKLFDFTLVTIKYYFLFCAVHSPQPMHDKTRYLNPTLLYHLLYSVFMYYHE